MGVWMRALGRLEVEPAPDEKLLLDFYRFNRTHQPNDYKRMEEHFSNTWFFDENNRMACLAGKFAEPTVWFRFMRDVFFEPRGYSLIGNLNVVGECESNEIWDRSIVKEYECWEKRIKELEEKHGHQLEYEWPGL